MDVFRPCYFIICQLLKIEILEFKISKGKFVSYVLAGNEIEISEFVTSSYKIYIDR